MDSFRLPPGTHIGHVRLKVADLERSLVFYRDVLGFRPGSGQGLVALSATGKTPYHILLSEVPGARPKPPRTTGLYHVAIRFPGREALAQTLRRLLDREWPLQGVADHGVSEAIYLADPDGNGLELYADRPRSQWRVQNGQVAMATDPLDVQDLLAQAGERSEPGLAPGTDIGHVHLHVSDLARAEAFYHGLLGLDVTQRGYPGALFLSAGGYHHHVGLNTWAGVGASAPPPDAVGLESFALVLPEPETWRDLFARLADAGIAVSEGQGYGYASSARVSDPDGNGVELLVKNGNNYRK